MMVNPTGGMGYHLGALRSARSRWRAFRAAIAGCLENWMPSANRHDREIILVGPSGGYCLDGRWLSQFTKITVVEIDPFARLILRIRFSKLNFEFITHDILVGENLTEWLTLLASAPASPVLFCNILGQLPLFLAMQGEDWGRARISAILTSVRGKRPWASFHDRVSFDAIVRHGSTIFSKQTELTTAQIVDIASRRWKINEFCDHGTDEIAKSAAIYFAWALTPRRIHIVEWVSVE